MRVCVFPSARMLEKVGSLFPRFSKIMGVSVSSPGNALFVAYSSPSSDGMHIYSTVIVPCTHVVIQSNESAIQHTLSIGCYLHISRKKSLVLPLFLYSPWPACTYTFVLWSIIQTVRTKKLQSYKACTRIHFYLLSSPHLFLKQRRVQQQKKWYQRSRRWLRKCQKNPIQTNIRGN